MNIVINIKNILKTLVIGLMLTIFFQKYPRYSIKITRSNLRMLLSTHVSHEEDEKKISWSRVDYDFALGSGRKCLWENENLCENIQWTKVISRRKEVPKCWFIIK